MAQAAQTYRFEFPCGCERPSVWEDSDLERLVRAIRADSVAMLRKREGLSALEAEELWRLAAGRGILEFVDRNDPRRRLRFTASVPARVEAVSGGAGLWALCYREQNSGYPWHLEAAVPLFMGGDATLVLCDMDLTPSDIERVRG